MILPRSHVPRHNATPLCAKARITWQFVPLFRLISDMLKIYNSLARDKQDFVPIEPGHVRMYVCGMTVYDYCHLGHARVMVVFDMVARWLRACGYRVTYVRNITDIDDKIIRRARRKRRDRSAR